MSAYTASNWVGDPINHPGMIPLDAWHSYHLKMFATCQGCGRRREVHRAELIKRYGYGGAFPQAALDRLAPKLKCVSCERRGPKLTLEVHKD